MSTTPAARLARLKAGYPAQIRHAVSDFETWHDLVAAGFPPVEAPDDGAR